MSRTVHLIAVALTVTAVAAPMAQAGTGQSAQPKVDPLAVSYVRGQGLSASQVRDWTVGACSHQAKPTGCYSAVERSAAPAEAVGSNGFDWADAGIGAGATLGMVLLLAGLGAALVISRQNRRQQAPSM